MSGGGCGISGGGTNSTSSGSRGDDESQHTVKEQRPSCWNGNEGLSRAADHPTPLSLPLPHPQHPPPRAANPGCKVEVGPSLDLTSQESVKGFASTIARRAGPLNILVNNAGMGYTKKEFTPQGVGMLTQVRGAARRAVGVRFGVCRCVFAVCGAL